jgi:hypothetical protein
VISGFNLKRMKKNSLWYKNREDQTKDHFSELEW